jgi:hypothetical protein
MGSVKEKDPESTLDYFIDWSAWLGEDSIVESEWDVPDGLVLEDESEEDGRCTVWLSGGTVGTLYAVTNQITTNSTPPRVEERTLYIKIENR